MELDSNVATASSTCASNTNRTYIDRNVTKEGGEINQNINKAVLTTKTPTEDMYDTDEEEKSKNGKKARIPGSQKKGEESYSDFG
eukprot:9533691-Ditylum_brightwellii.AAC.1